MPNPLYWPFGDKPFLDLENQIWTAPWDLFNQKTYSIQDSASRITIIDLPTASDGDTVFTVPPTEFAGMYFLYTARTETALRMGSIFAGWLEDGTLSSDGGGMGKTDGPHIGDTNDLSFSLTYTNSLITLTINAGTTYDLTGTRILF